MSQVIPEKYRDLFQKRAFASLGTLMPDGRPQGEKRGRPRRILHHVARGHFRRGGKRYFIEFSTWNMTPAVSQEV